MAEESDFQKRIPSVERCISEIQPEDIRVCILGTIVDKKETTLIVDDGTGKITVRFEEPVTLPMNTLVRIFGRVVPIENGFEIQGEIVQDMSKLNIELYKKVREIVKENGLGRI